MNNNEDETGNKDIYIEAIDWGWAGVPVESQKWGR
jgi:hypothetical protein